jgi:hypothetical protein
LGLGALREYRADRALGNIPEMRELAILAGILDHNRVTREKCPPASAAITGFHTAEAVKEFRAKTTLSDYFEVTEPPVDELDIAKCMASDSKSFFQYKICQEQFGRRVHLALPSGIRRDAVDGALHHPQLGRVSQQNDRRK